MAAAATTWPEEPTAGSEPPRPSGLPVLTPELVGLLEVPPNTPEHLSIAEVSDLTGVSTYTLRYWERIGLLAVDRARSRRRVYNRDAVAQVLFIARLRRSEMSIGTMRRYVELVNAGEHTAPERLELMRAHRAAVTDRLDALHAALAVIDHKIDIYAGLGTSG